MYMCIKNISFPAKTQKNDELSMFGNTNSIIYQHLKCVLIYNAILVLFKNYIYCKVSAIYFSIYNTFLWSLLFILQ